MRSMYRYEVLVDDQWHQFELRGPIRHVAARRADAVEFWAEHDDHAVPTHERLLVVGTGHSWPPGSEWVGTALAPRGLVWHLLRDQSHLNWGQR